MIINLISSPRNVSTALMYAFAHRGDTKVVDEPYYAYYLYLTGADHPGKDEIIASQPTSYLEVVENMNRLEEQCGNVFIKNMAHHLIEMDVDFLTKWTNLFLIRNPKQLIASFAQVIPNPTQTDIGIKRQFELYIFLKEMGQEPIVIDSGELLNNPIRVFSRLCDKLQIEMLPSMLKWEAGAIEEDGIWAKYWYKNVHQSTGFTAQKTSDRELPDRCQKLYEESLPFYQELYKHAIKAN
ncbi:sulfotransferase family protein [Marinoscillum sp. MHG1-6]|uniref:sulfotransferase-like domain-containing protein n=1 Tax=Marinoscillum sp. MHG1-6 TaxID=2959627 RepID=UPI002156FE72|nr:sulfotransferase family protein [Marinoscillum sp. MHG1-6]